MFDSMREVLKLHLESGSDGSETSFRRDATACLTWDQFREHFVHHL